MRVETLEDARRYARQYINNQEIITKRDFYKEHHLNSFEAINISKLLKENDPELYEQYTNVKDNPNPARLKKEALEYAKGKEELDKILEGLMYGIDNREFDILDYFTITKKSYSELMKIFEKSDYGMLEKKLLLQFFNKNTMNIWETSQLHSSTNPKLLIKKTELEGKTVVGGVELTTEDKLEIFKFFEENEIPLFRKLYSIKVRRFVQEKKAHQHCKKLKSEL